MYDQSPLNCFGAAIRRQVVRDNRVKRAAERIPLQLEVPIQRRGDEEKLYDFLFQNRLSRCVKVA